MCEILYKKNEEVYEHVKNIFKHSGEVAVKISNRKSNYLKKESVEYNSIADIKDDGIVITKNKARGKIYKFSFKVPMGLSFQINNENERQLTQLLSSCNGKMKFWLLNEQKNMLNENMDMIKKRINEMKDNDSLTDACVNRYLIMQTMEKISYSTGYIFVDESVYKFEELAGRFLNIYQLKEENLFNFLERINNDPLRGDKLV